MHAIACPWRRLVRLWSRLSVATQGAVVVIGLMVIESQVVLWWSVQDQKSVLGPLTALSASKRLMLVLAHGCLTLAFVLGGYSVLKRSANWPFLVGRIADLASWIIIGLLLIALINLFFR